MRSPLCQTTMHVRPRRAQRPRRRDECRMRLPLKTLRHRTRSKPRVATNRGGGAGVVSNKRIFLFLSPFVRSHPNTTAFTCNSEHGPTARGSPRAPGKVLIRTRRLGRKLTVPKTNGHGFCFVLFSVYFLFWCLRSGKRYARVGRIDL